MKTLLALLLIPAISSAQVYGGNPWQQAATNFALGMNQAVANQYVQPPQYFPQFDYQYQRQLQDQHNLIESQQHYLDNAAQQLQAARQQKAFESLNNGAVIFEQPAPGWK